MNQRDPRDPNQHSESFQFIQSLFDEEESARSKIRRLLAGTVRLVSWGLLIALICAAVWLGWYFEIENIAVTKEGLWLPTRD